MAEIARRLEPGFAVADASYPSFQLADGKLILGFSDWTEREVQVELTNTAGFDTLLGAYPQLTADDLRACLEYAAAPARL